MPIKEKPGVIVCFTVTCCKRKGKMHHSKKLLYELKDKTCVHTKQKKVFVFSSVKDLYCRVVYLSKGEEGERRGDWSDVGGFSSLRSFLEL